MPGLRVLKAVTWNHTRAVLPLVAASQRYSDEHPDVRIDWERWPQADLQATPIEKLTAEFDLLMIDHTLVGAAAAKSVLVPLDKNFDKAYLSDHAANSVGASGESLVASKRTWALPIDASVVLSGHRADLIEKIGTGVPRSWDSLLSLAKRGRVVIPGGEAGPLVQFFMLVLAHGEEPCKRKTEIASFDTAMAVLDLLRELYSAAGVANLARNSVDAWEALARTDEFAYCPFAEGYAVYGRSDYADRPITFGELVTFNRKMLRSTHCGAGLAISANTSELRTALDFLQRVTCLGFLRGLPALTGGQPAHCSVWTDRALDQRSNGFFSTAMPLFETAFVRPRYAGYGQFERGASEVIRSYVREGGDPWIAFSRMNDLYRASRRED